jgi:hypothetical protein
MQSSLSRASGYWASFALDSRDIVDVLADADPEDKAEAYAELGVGLTYHTDARVAVQARGVRVRVGRGT